ncbi:MULTISPECIES: hypothetical protein [unclassified Nodularia (in: cyanobacteria)]|uniref:hypothetical protein n=1 Tax=unclassified Nodularia (in: cyanobacteria) TaxID=2656917 RepID=UPI00187FE942|nr:MULTISPECIES: hypothetical protein [unclassified Nodularia (in: cyanobacteria)]MBE9201634.1 hypothetical protein [Nodularia sp. LEGE 06071]MCC2691898.1 hypothetical protein [Nodularia sp. LEGE 04288]
MVRLFVTVILLGLLMGCGSIGLLPNTQLVKKAIAFQVEQTQQQLNEKLDLDFQGFEIKRLKIQQEQPLTIQSLPAFRVRGTYDLILNLPKRQLKQLQQPFEVYLQIQQEGKSWRLLVPALDSQDSPKTWRSYLIL